MDPRDPDVLYAAGWHRIRWGGGHMEGAGAGSGIWKSTDGGRSWDRLTDPELATGLPGGRLGRIGIGIAASEPDRVYAVIQDARSAYSPTVSISGGVYRSDDAGASWRQVHDISAHPDYYYNEVWVDPTDADRLYLAGTWLAVSDDGGRSFENMERGPVHVDHHALWIDPADGDHMVLGNDGGVYRSWDRGESWEHLPMPVGQYYEVMVDSTKTPYHVCGGTQDNGTWCGPSRTRERVGITDHDWYAIYGGDGFDSAVSVDSPQIRYAEWQYGSVGRLNTDTWEVTPLQPHSEDAGWLSGYPFRWDWNTPLVISHHDPTTVYLGGNHLFRLEDRGTSWEILGPDMTRANRFDPEPDSAHTSYRSLHSIAESRLDADRLWTGSNDGLIWTSSDGGESWDRVNDDIPDDAVQRCFVAEIEASHHDPDRAYVVHDCHRRDDYRPHVFRTDDGGRRWSDITGDLPTDAGSWVVRESWVNPDLLFVGNERGVYVTLDGGRHWARMDGGLPTVGVRDMDFAYAENDLVVGTFGRSIYLLDIGPLHELTPGTLAGPHLFAVEDARTYNRRDTYASFGDQFFTADNPPYGVTVTYYLPDDLGEEATLTIHKLDEADGPRMGDGDPPAGEPARDRPDRVPAADRTEDGAETGATVARVTGSGRPGLHRVTWDLATSEPRPRELGGPTGRDELRTAEAGRYEVRLQVGDETLTRTFLIRRGWVEEAPGRVR
jgi:photosystem II stability/assembly factor-like uncharacterized protein